MGLNHSPEDARGQRKLIPESVPRCTLPPFQADSDALSQHYKSVLVEVLGELFFFADADHASAYSKLQDLFVEAGYTGDVSIVGAGHLVWKNESTVHVFSCEDAGLGAYNSSTVCELIKKHFSDLDIYDGD